MMVSESYPLPVTSVLSYAVLSASDTARVMLSVAPVKMFVALTASDMVRPFNAVRVIVLAVSSEEVIAMESLPVVPKSIAKLPEPSSLPTEYAVLVLSESVRVPPFISRAPAIVALVPIVNVELILVVPAPAIALFNVPVVIKVPKLVIVPPRLEIAVVNCLPAAIWAA